jgi:ABC-type multidrug transport system ATPase subunit
MQPSQEIFDLFDKVLVLNEGQCIYFGPTSKALQHFQGLWLYADSCSPDTL